MVDLYIEIAYDEKNEIELSTGKIIHFLERINKKSETEYKNTSEDTIRQFKTVLENANYGVAIADLNGILTYTNRWFADLHGYSPDELTGKPISILHSEKQMENVSTLLDLLNEKGHFEDKEVWHRHRSGRVFPTRMNANIISDNNNKPLYLSATLCDITEEKKKEKILQDNEEKLRLKLENILSPDYDIKEEELKNIINTKEIQSLMEDFHRITNTGIAILDIKGNILVATEWQDICTKFHRINSKTEKNCTESDLALTNNIKPGEIRQYKCKNNLWDIVTPIYIAGRHMGNMYLGQFFYEDEVPEISVFEKQAEIYGFDREKYIEAVNKVPHLSRENVRNIVSFYKKFALMVSKLSYTNIKLTRLLIENKEKDKKLKLSEEKYRSYIERSPEGIFVVDDKGHFTEVNKTACKMLGYEEDELLMMSVPDLLFEEDSEELIEYFKGLKESEQSIREIKLKRRDGTDCPLILSTTVLPNNTYLAFSTDITKRKESEEKISQLNCLLSAIRNINRLIVSEKDRGSLIKETCRILTVNGGYYDTWIILLDENGNITDSAHSGLGDLKKCFDDYLKSGKIPYCAKKALESDEINIITRNNGKCDDCALSERDNIGRLTTRLKYNNRIYGVISIALPEENIPDEVEYNLISEVAGDLGFALKNIELEEDRIIRENEIKDINRKLKTAYTELEENQEELRQNYNNILASQNKLRESENRLFDIINFLPDATFAIDKEGRTITWNKAMERMTGISAEEMIGKDNFEYSVKIYGERRPVLIDLILNDELKKEINYPVLYEDGDKLVGENYVPYLSGGKGTYLWFTASPLYDSKGNIAGAIESIRDISEIKSAEEKIIQTSFELSERVKELTALKEFSDIIITEPDEKEFFEATANIIKNAMQYPEYTGVLIENGMDKYQTEGFYKTSTAIENNFDSDKINGGRITVCLLNSPDNHSGSFLDEEKNLLAIICERIGNYLSRITVEINLKNSEERFRELFNNMSSGVAVYEVIENGNDFKFKDINKASEKIDNIERDKIINRSIFDVFPGVREFGLTDVLKKVWITGKPEHHSLAEYKDERIQGWRENFIYRLPSGEVVTVYNDLTEKKKSEDALRENEHKYHELFNNINEAVFLNEVKENNRLGNFVEVNDVACRRLGYTREELLKLNVSDIDIIDLNGRDKKTLEQINENEVLELINKNDVFSFESEQKRKDGSLFPVHIKSKKIEMRGKKYILSLVRDITEEKSARMRENAALYQIEKNISQLAILNDEIRNPLTVIVALTDLAEEGFKEKIFEQSMQINDIISRLDSGWLESAKIRDYLAKHHGIEYKTEKKKKLSDKNNNTRKFRHLNKEE